MTRHKQGPPPVKEAALHESLHRIDAEDTGDRLVIAGRETSQRDGPNPSTVSVPLQMREADRWLLWRGKKVPYRASDPKRTASSTDPASWSSFATANGVFDPDHDGGLGFALGDGFACVDIDHCGADNEAARFLLENVGCTFIEVSPSGDGLHGWALSHDKLPRCKGTLDGLSVEVYNADRYMTVTGRSLVSGPLRESDGILRLSKSLCPHLTESPESQESYESQEDHVLVVVEKFIPKKNGQRNQKLFEWCRHVKTKHPDANTAEQVAYARQWYKAALPYIGTKDPGVTIADFLRGWEVALPEGFGIETLMAEAKRVPVPNLIAQALEPHAVVFGLCVVLQRQRPDRPFFLPTRKLGEMLGVTYPTAANRLQVLHRLGVIVMAEKHTRTRATRYYVSPEYL